MHTDNWKYFWNLYAIPLIQLTYQIPGVVLRRLRGLSSDLSSRAWLPLASFLPVSVLLMDGTT